MPLLPVLAEIVDTGDVVAGTGEPNRLQGYLFRSPADGVRPLVLAIVGAGSTAEAGYGELAVPVIDRGMDCLILHAQSGQQVLPLALRWIADRTGLNPARVLLASDPFGDELTRVAEPQPLAAGPVPLEIGGVELRA
jgi:hypothetical protein